MEDTVHISQSEGSYLLPLILARINDLKHTINPTHQKEIAFKGMLYEELSRLEEIQHKLVELYTRSVKVS